MELTISTTALFSIFANEGFARIPAFTPLYVSWKFYTCA